MHRIAQTTRRRFLQTSAAATLAAALPRAFAAVGAPVERPRVGVFYFPQWHIDPHNEKMFHKGWTEWESVRDAKPRFPGHLQPKVPLWGYENEADPRVMQKKIDVAADHGVDFFIFDWYYGMRPGEGPFLQRCLEKGYLRAPNNSRVKFCCMWANHRPVDRRLFDAATNHLIETCLAHPSHYQIDGRPLFSIYEIDTLIKGLGGVNATREALADFRSRVAKRTNKTLHLNVIDHQPRLQKDPAGFLKQFGFDSVTSYVWIHMVPVKFPTMEYEELKGEYLKYADGAAAMYGVPYYPNVSMGWDPTPRMPKGQPHDNRGYPNMGVVVNNTPDKFRQALLEVKARAMKLPPAQRIVTINSWNEWTEGSYIEPDMTSGMQYLEAIREVMG
jgi:hypothetical protein